MFASSAEEALPHSGPWGFALAQMLRMRTSKNQEAQWAR